mmetsp:Transcript_34976/g.69446  ORF Transcript_34976/g.69446 Transcript_34976/m.69446 type:complete len:205 (-) Transcript_34976:90-704(-)
MHFAIGRARQGQLICARIDGNHAVVAQHLGSCTGVDMRHPRCRRSGVGMILDAKLRLHRTLVRVEHGDLRGLHRGEHVGLEGDRGAGLIVPVNHEQHERVALGEVTDRECAGARVADLEVHPVAGMEGRLVVLAILVDEGSAIELHAAALHVHIEGGSEGVCVAHTQGLLDSGILDEGLRPQAPAARGVKAGAKNRTSDEDQRL